MKYHPMDDTLRPAASAARKSAHGLDPRSPTTSESTTFVDDPDNSDETTDDEDLDPSDDNSSPVLGSLPSLPCRPIPPRCGSPSSRRVTRAEINGEKPVLYSMKHHPMDMVMRPASAKKFLRQWTTPSPLSMAMKPKQGQRRQAKQVSAASRTPTPVSNEEPDGVPTPEINREENDIPSIENMTKEPATSAWKSLLDSERLVYLFQKGARPTSSSTLPMSWEVVERLQSGSRAPGDVAAVRHHYAKVYQAVQEDFGADNEPATKEDWTLFYAEDFDVYDLEVGDRYFKHRKDSIASPTSHSARNWTPGQQDQGLCSSDGNREENQRDSQDAEKASERQGLPPSYLDYMDHQSDHGLKSSYNNAEGYLRQTTGLYDEDLTTEEDLERVLFANLQDSESLTIHNALGRNDIPPTFSLAFQPTGDCEGEEEERKPSLKRRSKNRGTGSRFSVHEDEPGSTPKIKKEIAMNPKSPGTDMPKENYQERSSPIGFGS